MDNTSAIAVSDVGKRFRLRSAGGRTLKSAALDLLRMRARRHDFWALRELSFSVARGETLGIIGANGAGKSTLLALLAGTKTPTRGRVDTRGTISSLLELGAGFHPDLTGRENVFLSGAIMGIPRRRISERFDRIVEFAGLRDFIDQPVRHYSSGMYVRLGFAVAVEVDPDILLIDEVLAVGDEAFQRKCLETMRKFREQSKTMLIISHDLATIQRISDRILLLDEGRIVGLGEPDAVVGQYRSLSRRRSVSGLEREWGTGEVRIADVALLDDSGAPAETFRWGGGLTARLSYDASQPIEQPVFGFAVSDAEGRLIFGSNTQIDGFEIPEIRGAGRLTLRLEQLPMAAGTYLLSFSVHSADHRTNYHRLDHCFPIAVESDRNFEGCCFIPTQWRRGE